MPQKILFFFNSLKPSGGIERVIVTVANKLCKYYNITILVKDNGTCFYKLDERIKVIGFDDEIVFNMSSKVSRFFTAILSVFKSSILLRNFLKKDTFDYFYIAHPLNALEFHVARGIRNSDTIITEHGSFDAYNLIYKLIKRKLYNKAKVYIVPTSFDSSYYESIKIPCKYLPHFKSNLNYEPSQLNQKIAINIGRFTEVKQQIILLKIWNKIIKVRGHNDWKLFLIGEGELKEEFNSYISENDLSKNVFLLQPTSDVEKYYKNASLFLLSSRTEGFGMVLLEAISFGLPCISFDCPSGPRDIIQNNENGFLIRLNDEEAFEKAVADLINNPDMIFDMGKKSLEISKRWNDNEIMNSWIKILN